MSKPGTAWFPFYIDDWDRATDELTNEEEHAYFRLIKAYYGRGEPLKDDDHRLAIITRRTPAAWKKLRPVMAGFFCIKDGQWRHKRIDRELDLRASLHAERSRAGSHGNERRWKNSGNGHDRATAPPPAEPEEETRTISTEGVSQSDSSAITERSQNDPYSHLHQESSRSLTATLEPLLDEASLSEREEGASLASPGGPRDAPPPPEEGEASEAAAEDERFRLWKIERDAETQRLIEQRENLQQEAMWREEERLKEHRKNAEMIRQVQIEAAKRKLLYDLPTPKADA